MEIIIPHQLPQEEALARIRKLLGRLREEQKDVIKNVSEEWTENDGRFSFTAKGFDISGDIEVKPTEVKINSELPFLVSFFKDKITELISKQAGELLKP